MEIDPIIFRLAIFILSIFVGYYVVWSVTPALHTPLMSVTNEGRVFESHCPKRMERSVLFGCEFYQDCNEKPSFLKKLRNKSMTSKNQFHNFHIVNLSP